MHLGTDLEHCALVARTRAQACGRANVSAEGGHGDAAALGPGRTDVTASSPGSADAAAFGPRHTDKAALGPGRANVPAPCPELMDSCAGARRRELPAPGVQMGASGRLVRGLGNVSATGDSTVLFLHLMCGWA